MRRLVFGLSGTGLAMGLLATLTACGGAGASSGEGVTLKVIAVEHGDRAGDSSQLFWDKLIGEFQFEHPGIEVDVDLYERDVIDAKVREMVEAGRHPDLAQTGGAFAAYAERGQLYSARDVLSTATQLSFVEPLAKAGSVRRVQYAMPFTASTRALFYNKALFAKADLEEPPATWKELRESARALRAAGVETPYGLPLGGADAQAEALSWMIGGDGGYVSDGGTYDFDSPENIATFAWLRDKLVRPGLTYADPATTDRDEAYADFAAGKVAMLNGHPGLMQTALEHGVRFGTAPLPGKKASATGTTGVADWMMAFEENGRAEQIRTFLDFVYQDRFVVEYADTYDMVPVTVGATEAMREGGKHRTLGDFVDALDTARFYPLGKSSWGRTETVVKDTVGAAARKDGRPRTVLTKIQREAMAAESAD